MNTIALLAEGQTPIVCTQVELLLGKYPEIKMSAFNENITLCNSFVKRISNFYKKEDNHIEVTLDSLSYIIPLINDNHSVESDLIRDIISNANEFVNGLDTETWMKLFKEETLPSFQLFKMLVDLKKYNHDKFVENANSAFAEILKSISKKEMSVPPDLVFWDMLFKMFGKNQTYTFKEVRDNLLVHTYGPVSIEEFTFFEKGLFEFGNLDEKQAVADDTIRRILVHFASSDPNYLAMLKRNKEVVAKIIEKAKDSISEFKTALESNCNDIFNDPDMESVISILNRKTTLIAKALNLLKPSNPDQE